MTKRAIPLGEVWGTPLADASENSITGADGRRLKRSAAPDLLEQFCSIAEAADTASAVAVFAKRWGLLGLCEHGLPSGHRSPRCIAGRGRESVQHWMELTRAFDSMLRIGLDLSRRDSGADLDWQLADSGICRDDFTPWDEETRKTITTDHSLVIARTHYMTLMRRLIEISNMQPRFHWSNRAWNIDLDAHGDNLPAILTAQLMLRIAGARNQIKCSECLSWFIPKRNQRKYCNRCGIKASWRAAQRKRRCE